MLIKRIKYIKPEMLYIIKKMVYRMQNKIEFILIFEHLIKSLHKIIYNINTYIK